MAWIYHIRIIPGIDEYKHYGKPLSRFISKKFGPENKLQVSTYQVPGILIIWLVFPTCGTYDICSLSIFLLFTLLRSGLLCPGRGVAGLSGHLHPCIYDI